MKLIMKKIKLKRIKEILKIKMIILKSLIILMKDILQCLRKFKFIFFNYFYDIKNYLIIK